MADVGSGRLRSWWGWGWEDQALDDAECVALGSMLGGLADSPLPVPVVGRSDLPEPRLAPPDALVSLVDPDPRARASHARGKAYRDVIRALHGDLGAVPDLVLRPRDEADIVSHIGEIDSRRLYAREACSSMFGYCTEVLHLSEAEAYLRIAAARASREHPLLLTMLADGRLHLTAIAKLAPHLTAENREVLLERAAHRSRRQVEELVAEISPRPDTPALMRKLPSRRDGPLPSPRPGPDTDASSIELRPDGVASTGAPLRPDGVAPSDRQSHSGGTALVDRQLRT